MIDILSTNRNSAIIIDSDKSSDEKEINATKERIKNEFKESGKFCWITQGREIENYIDCNSINLKYSNKKRKQIGIYEDFKDYIKESDPNFESHKVQTAKSLDFTKDSLDILDLKEKISQLVNEIKKWNK